MLRGSILFLYKCIYKVKIVSPLLFNITLKCSQYNRESKGRRDRKEREKKMREKEQVRREEVKSMFTCRQHNQPQRNPKESTTKLIK